MRYDTGEIYKRMVGVYSMEMIHCYREYIGLGIDNPPTQKEYILNMEQKMADAEFLGDIEMLLRPNEKYNPQDAWELVKKEIISKM